MYYTWGYLHYVHVDYYLSTNLFQYNLIFEKGRLIQLKNENENLLLIMSNA